MDKVTVLKQCTVDGNIVKLPDTQLDRKIYLEVKKALNLIGGKWKGRPVFGFVFPQDPTELLKELVDGKQRNLKKEFQFFETSPELADRLVKLADIQPRQNILEPSAGQGAIIKAILRAEPSSSVSYYELMDINQKFLDKTDYCTFLGCDFLEADRSISFDRIIANPPFAKNQDIDHVNQMYQMLIPGGRLVSIMSKHWTFSTNKKETAFRTWMDVNDAQVIKIEGGAFKTSGTMVGGVIVIIDK